MASPQQRYRNFSSDSMGRERVPSDDGYYQGMLKAMDGRKGTNHGGKLMENSLIASCDLDLFVPICVRCRRARRSKRSI